MFRLNVNPMKHVEKELLDAEMSLLEAQTALEYARAMVGYHSTRRDRLKAMLAQPTTDKAQALHAEV